MGNSIPKATTIVQNAVNDGVLLAEKIAIVTGASSGIGINTAAALATANMHVVMACRDMAKAESIAATIRAESGNEKVKVMQCDLSSLESVKNFASDFKANFDKLHLLVNNAGIMALPNFTESADGVEMQFAVNHLGHFALTLSLLDYLSKCSPSRIVNVSSSAHRLGDFKKRQLPPVKEEYGAFSAYGDSKLCNVLFSKELHRRFASNGVSAYAAHPGVINTSLDRNNFVMRMGYSLGGWAMRSLEQGAATTCVCAVSKQADTLSGNYFEDCKIATPQPLADDEELALKLWNVSLDLCKQTLPDLSVDTKK